VLPLAEAVPDAGPEDENDGDGVTMNLLLLGKGDELELNEERDELPTGDVELDGGGIAALASTSLPLPQGIGSP